MFSLQLLENKTAIQGFFHHRHEKDSASAHNQGIFLNHTGHSLVIYIGKIGIDPGDQKAHENRAPIIYTKAYQNVYQAFGNILPGCLQGLSQKPVKDRHNAYKIHQKINDIQYRYRNAEKVRYFRL